MKYFAKITDTGTQSRNNLDKAVKDFVKTQDNTLLQGSDQRAHFINSIIRKVQDLSAEFPRCKKVNADLWEDRHEKTQRVGASSVFTICIYPVDREI
jgi:hypothetical protein